jgi:hypothetical protein
MSPEKLTNENDALAYLFSIDSKASLGKLRESINTKTTASPFYKYQRMDFGSSSTVRFLPRSTDVITTGERPPFWLHKRVLRLEFANPQTDGGTVTLMIPMLSMYTGCQTKDDPILSLVSEVYDEADAEAKAGHTERAEQLRAVANRHWVKAKGEALAQGFVIRPGFIEDNVPENPVRVFELKPQIMNKIIAAINEEDPDRMLDGSPEGGRSGTNFIIKRTKSGDGKWPSYAESGFVNKSSPLTEHHLAAIRTLGLFDLAAFLPTQPTAAEYEMLATIVRQSIAGDRSWNPEWEAHLINVKPYKEGRRQEADEGPGHTVAGVAAVIDAMNRTGRKSDVTKTQAETAPQAEADEHNAAAANPALERAKAIAAKVREKHANKASPQGETFASLQAAA